MSGEDTNEVEKNDPTSSEEKGGETTEGTVTTATAADNNNKEVSTSHRQEEMQQASQKKRTADRQINKDEYDDGAYDEEGSPTEIKHGFKRASDEVLKTRRIVKVRRPGGASASTVPDASATTATTTTNATSSAAAPPAAANTNDNDRKEDVDDAKEGESKPTNPFASTKLVASSFSSDASKPKVFGSGSAFSGFKTAIPASGGGFGTASTTGGFGGFGSNSNNGTGFGTGAAAPAAAAAAAAAPASGSSGFGRTATANSSLFGTNSNSSTGFSSIASQTSNAGSLFQTNGSSGVVFAFGKKSESKGDDCKPGEGDSTDDANDNNSKTGRTTVPAVKLPEHVELTTGEEDEDVVHDGRCKSFHWVPKKDDSTAAAADTETTAKANLSVKPSTEFEAAISTIKNDNKDKADESKERTDGASEEDSESNNNKDEGATKEGGQDASTKTEQTESNSSPEQFRWQELGVGPIKILCSMSDSGKYRIVQRRESTKNGPATKVILNIPLWKESKLEQPAPKFLTVKTLVGDRVESYMLRFKDTSDASHFHHYLSESVAKSKPAFA
jgi:hypothetical protein